MAIQNIISNKKLFSFLQNQNSSAKVNGGISNQNYKEKFQRTKEEMHFMKRNDAYMTNLFAAPQKRVPQEMGHHAALARTVSTPISDANQQAVVNNLFTSLNDILNGAVAAANGNGNVVGGNGGHRKLERTQSEPLPQTNTSR